MKSIPELASSPMPNITNPTQALISHDSFVYVDIEYPLNDPNSPRHPENDPLENDRKVIY
jgi:hypothetical protein